ncbi:hypothetical protein TI39_contig4116g00017 [Zymoseptoria brevis]|uniref:Uncharacterized protein n=1 Tax=Zymoseptoria brevis TaxID=1047168 RepID=A0A0F4GGP8_9PEZI|nr:hypothetical protein TI39_contig4116g00017 [Zymoseptoria brevis]
MAFQEEFEMSVNENMQDDDQHGRAPSFDDGKGADMKRRHFHETEAEDFNDKKDQPPRFSTLMGVAPKPAQPQPPPPPPPPQFYHEYYLPPREPRRGVYLSMPIFIVFVLVLFFESTLLFAYTIFGMYYNAPIGMFSWSQSNTTIAGCACDNSNPTFNIIMPSANGENISVTPTSSTIATSTTTDAKLVASGILSALAGLGNVSSTSSPIALVTITPTRSTVTSVKLLTADPSGNIIEPSMKVLTSTQMVDAPIPTSSAGITSRDVGAWAMISSGIESAQDSVSVTATSEGSAGTPTATSSGGS